MPSLHAIRPRRSLGTTDARTQLPALVKELVAVETPGATLADHAVQVTPRPGAGVWLVPEVDIDAAIDREAELTARVAELEDEAENLILGMMLTERLKTSGDASDSGEQFARDLGFDDLADELAS